MESLLTGIVKHWGFQVSMHSPDVEGHNIVDVLRPPECLKYDHMCKKMFVFERLCWQRRPPQYCQVNKSVYKFLTTAVYLVQ